MPSDAIDPQLKSQLVKMNWNIDHGCVKITIRHGKPTLIAIEKTVKLD